MSVIECPHCREPIQLTDLRPGRFVPTCPHCGVDFELIVPEDLTQSPRVAGLTDVSRETSSEFAILNLPDVAADPMPPERGGILGEMVDRLLFRVHQLRIGGLPAGIPRLVDEGRYVLLRQEGQGFYGPRFATIPWCGGALRTLWMLPPDLGHDPYYASRWVGEMLVAGELVHPNLEPFDTVGESRKLFRRGGASPSAGRGLFFATRPHEHVTPAIRVVQAAASPSQRQQIAAAIILQAARGLKYAHDQGVFHRDIRPENLVVDSNGYVRIVNFGLDSHPLLEDARRQRELAVIADKNTKNGQAPLPAIDRRAELEADLAGLGRTWLALGLDQPDTMTLPADSLSPRTTTLVPSLAAVCRKMLERNPEERYAAMGDVVQALETCLAARGPSALAQREPLTGLIRETGERLRGASNFVLRGFILRIAAGFWALLLLLCLMVGLWKVDLNLLVLGGMTVAWVAALADPSRGRRTGLTALVLDALRATSFPMLLAISILVAGLLLGGLWWGYLGTWIFFGILSFALATALEIGVGRGASREWRDATEAIARRVADLRLSGIRDETLRGWFESVHIPHSRELRQSLFRSVDPTEPEDEDTALATPAGRGWTSNLPSVREAIRRFLSERVRIHRDREHRVLVTLVETDRLNARGVNRLTAARRGRRVGLAVMSVIADWRLTRLWNASSKISLRPDLRKDLRQSVWQAVDDPERMLDVLEGPSSRLSRRAEMVVRTALGRLVRFAVGLAMLLLFSIWLDREGILTWGDVTKVGSDSYSALGRAIETQDPNELRQVRVPLPKDHRRLWEAWNEPLIHRDWSRYLSGLNLGLAGLILVLSAFFERFTVGLFAILGVVVILVGPVVARAELGDSLSRNTTAMWLIAGIVVSLLGFLIRPGRANP